MTHQPSGRQLTVWLLTTAVSVPLGWLAALALARPGSDLVWAALACGPPWVVLRLLAGDFNWNAFFFGFLPPVLAFEASIGLDAGLRQAVLLVALVPLVVYAILGFTTSIMFYSTGAAWLAREISDPDRDAGSLPRRLGLWLRPRIGSAARWYAVWLGGAAVGFGLALATHALARAAGALPPPLALLSRAVVGLVAGGFAWALLWLPGSSPRARDTKP